MAPSDDLATHATSSHDFYALLELDGTQSSTLTPHAIRRAHKRAALKHHPDKNAGDPIAAAEKFHLIQIAYEVLSDAGVRAAYDNAREARVQREKQRQAYVGRRKEMMEDLERREKAGAGAGFKSGAGMKRGRDQEEDPEERLAREVRRLAEDGKRRRTEREEALRREERVRERPDPVEVTKNGKSSEAATNSKSAEGEDRQPVQRSPTKAKDKDGKTGQAFEQSTLARLRAAAAAKKAQQPSQQASTPSSVTPEEQSTPAVTN
ncbi:MAG: hypothetical protein M4579_002678 [Chaenotheca gracillima]|nr:MAG: hypothetical protein M4579_002678 [Chaenotheca gracillima]